MNYYSEYGEDQWIDEHLILPEKGFYVDIGCASPIANSNTAFLRDKGWTGLAIDANNGWREVWQRHGREQEFRAAIIGEPGFCRMELNQAEPNLSRIVNVAQSEADGVVVSIEKLLIGIEHIDFLSVDVEGQEFNVILGFNVNRRIPLIISEYNTRGIGEDFRVKGYLEAEGYKEVHRTVANIIYLDERETHRIRE